MRQKIYLGFYDTKRSSNPCQETRSSDSKKKKKRKKEENLPYSELCHPDEQQSEIKTKGKKETHI